MTKWTIGFTFLSILFFSFPCSAQYETGEYRTAAGSAYNNFDTAQTITDLIPKARKYKSAGLLQLQVSGSSRSIQLSVYDYIHMTSINEGTMIIWGKREEHRIKMQRDRILSAEAVSYSILNMPNPDTKKEYSYKPADYKKEHLKISEASGNDALAISFLRYDLYLDQNGYLKNEDGYFKFFYNDKGDCIRAVHDKRQFRYFYKYDTQNNWTQRLIWDSDYGIIQKIDRKITYE